MPTTETAEPPAKARAHAPKAGWVEAARSWPLITEAPLLSEHLGRAHLAEIRVSPEAELAYRSANPDASFPDGSRIVEWLRDARNGRAGPIFALERRGESWVFSVLDPEGRILRTGALAPCTGCHAGAPKNPVFGPLTPNGAARESPHAVPRSP